MLGNLVGGLTFVGLTLYSTHYKTAPKRVVEERIDAESVFAKLKQLKPAEQAKEEEAQED